MSFSVTTVTDWGMSRSACLPLPIVVVVACRVLALFLVLLALDGDLAQRRGGHLDLSGGGEARIEGDEVQRLRPVAGRHQGGSQLESVGGGERMDRDQALGPGVGQGSEEHGVHQAEQGHAAADPEGERQ